LYTDGIQPLAERWDGRRWTLQSIRGGGLENDRWLTGVSCTSATWCVAVGVSRDSSSGGFVDYSLVEHWNGVRWAQRGVGAGGLSAVSCVSARACVAVGTTRSSYSGGDGDAIYAVARRWDGRRWSAQRIQRSGAWAQTSLRGVSCQGDACVAVGSFGTGERSTATGGTCTKGALVERWDGRAWSIQSAPVPPAAKDVVLDQVSCPLATRCMVTGVYTNDRGQSIMFAARWTGAGWTILPIIRPPGATLDQPTALSCSSIDACTAVGYTRGGSHPASLTERWNGHRWKTERIAGHAGTGPATLTGVSCVARMACRVVGGRATGARRTVTLAAIRHGSTWSVQRTPNAMFGVGTGTVESASLDSISCVSSVACTAVGSVGDQAGAARWDGVSWLIEPAPNPADARSSVLRSVSCTSASDCVAVGAYETPGGAEWVALAERWDGTRWSILPTPNPTRTSLYGVSCTSARACTAVGGTATRSGLIGPAIVERWDGRKWSIQPIPTQASATLSAVSCPSVSHCVAVGTSYGGSGAMPLIEGWDGTKWSIAQIAKPSGAEEASLSGVSCTSASACIAVGTSDLWKSPQASAVIEAWDGAHWSIQSAPNPAGVAGISLSGVSCPSATACVAVGDGLIGRATGGALLERWDGTSWSVEPSPNPGPGSTPLNAVSCSSPTVCTAVGGTATVLHSH
jgi:hypothetical protein